MLDLDDGIMTELYNNGIQDVMGMYAYKTSGKIALKHSIGIENTSEVAELTKALKTDAMSSGKYVEKELTKDIQAIANDWRLVISELSIGFIWLIVSVSISQIKVFWNKS